MQPIGRIELRDLNIAAQIGTYGPGDVVPDAHVLDMTLDLDPDKILVNSDSMDAVFDYDPLIQEIDALAKEQHYHTQERLISRIAKLCASYHEIIALDLLLSKTPVLGNTGKLGVRLIMDAPALRAFHKDAARY